ncbi:MAG TPA: fibronectin/fibrinogen-binding protein [Clostridiales bacterium]|nr:fibronectin/fibrinogen-binding protein [Clostridiales bacterium]
MPLDAVCLLATVREISTRIAGGRIDKIYQPERDEIVLSVRLMHGGVKLLLSVGAGAPRMHLIETGRENPAEPPMFCMLLRKHLQGAKIVSVTSPDLERMATIECDTVDEMGMPGKKYLAVEMMGKYSNIILYDHDGRILDAVKRIDGDTSGKRQVLPGLFYRMPPPQDKVSLLEVSQAGIAAAIRAADEDTAADRWLLSHFKGLSPLLCRELACRACGETAKPMCDLTDGERGSLADVLADFAQMIEDNRMKPYLLTRAEDGTVFDFTVLPVTQYGTLMNNVQIDSFSQLLSEFYEKKSSIERIRRRAQNMTHTIQNTRDRVRRKLATQRQELDRSQNREKYKRSGDLITANLYQIEPGSRKVRVIDYFDPACPEVEISMDVRLSPQQNAQKQFKLYNKAKHAEEKLTEQIAHGEQELTYLDSVLEAITQAENLTDLAQIQEELIQTGYLSAKQDKKKRRRAKPVQGKPFHYKTSDGFDVFAGKNNIQNDLLTLKTAFKRDIWFHTQKIHGSHVILVCDGREPTNTAMTEAAEIAAWHSQARGSAQIPVDYSQVRNIKKPNGAKPGMVIYHVYQTAFVTPDEKKIERMRIE